MFDYQNENNLIVLQKRLLALIMLATFIFCTLVVRLGFLQLAQGYSLQTRALDQWTRDLPLQAIRGDILDSENRILATSHTTFTVYVRPRVVENKEKLADLLSVILGLDYESTLTKINKRVSEVTIAKQIEKSKVDVLKSSGLKGIYFGEDSARQYPYGNFMTQVLGYTNIDNVGQAGMEAQYNKYLTGLNGIAYTQTDLTGVELEGRNVTYVPSIAGMNVKLTIDAEIQRYAEMAVSDAEAKYSSLNSSCIIIDSFTGGIVAMASTPSFDPNEPPRDNIDMLNTLVKNKMVVDVYEPGSTFKILTTAAALEEGLTKTSDRFYCPGYRIVDGQRIKCWKTIGHGSQNLIEGVRNSCNCVFMDLALRLGVDKFYEYMYKFGFGEKTGIDFAGESRGIILPQKTVKNIDLARIGFGQAVAVTPMQLVQAVSIVVNGGTEIEPHFLDSISTKDGKNVLKSTQKPSKRVISTETSQTMVMMLESVVAEGSGRNAQVAGYRVGGKTGTAQKYSGGIIAQGKYVSSFIGFGPVENPRYVILMVVDEPKGYVYYGSLVAAPYAGRVFDMIFSYKNIAPTTVDTSLTDKRNIEMPDLFGMTLTEAAGIIAGCGLQYEVVGENGRVVSQTPAAGTMVAKKDIILIRLE